mmetsp:Transcript_17452/g.54076  ORF Transcript_17452/g.54076 Transcript_17452/m.54076 type:complete len:249 (-) Transcript_17452:545-1291(-)
MPQDLFQHVLQCDNPKHAALGARGGLKKVGRRRRHRAAVFRPYALGARAARAAVHAGGALIVELPQHVAVQMQVAVAAASRCSARAQVATSQVLALGSRIDLLRDDQHVSMLIEHVRERDLQRAPLVAGAKGAAVIRHHRADRHTVVGVQQYEVLSVKHAHHVLPTALVNGDSRESARIDAEQLFEAQLRINVEHGHVAQFGAHGADGLAREVEHAGEHHGVGRRQVTLVAPLRSAVMAHDERFELLA